MQIHQGRNHMFSSGVLPRVWMPALAVLASGLFFTAQVGGAAPKQTPAVTIPNAVYIQQLKTTRALLERANHDYDGYRAKAVHQVTKAIHALEGTKNKHTAQFKKGGNEPQSVSDMQLRQAVKELQAVQMQLPAGSTASQHIGKAIADLNTALAIK
jgi:hypothetical protein